MYKATGKAISTQKEFKKIIFYVEIILNNQPLMYFDDDIQYPVLTPNILLHGQPIQIPERNSRKMINF